MPSPHRARLDSRFVRSARLLLLSSLVVIGCSSQLPSAGGGGDVPIGPAEPAVDASALLERVALVDGRLRVDGRSASALDLTADDTVSEAETLLRRGLRRDALALLLDAVSVEVEAGTEALGGRR